MLPLGELATGLAFLFGTLGACVASGALAVHRWCRWLEGAPAVLAQMVAVTAAVIAAHLIPGALGVLTPLAALVAALAIAGAALLLARGETRPTRPRPASERGFAHAPGGGRWSWVLAGGAAVLTAGCALALVRDVAGAPISSIDALNFQVPIPARWLQTDSVWGLHQFVAEYSNATYPQHGNLLVAAVMLPFDSAFLARLVAVPYWGLAAVAVYALARELGAARTSAVLGGAAFAAVPVFLRAGLEGVQTDAPMLACLGAGGVFLLRHHRNRARGELVLAALALGLALGTKWYALTSVAAVGLVWLAARRDWRAAAGLASVTLVAGGFWFARNWVEAGNPLFPQPLEPLFSAPEDPLRELGGFTLAHYLLDFEVWDTYLRPAFAATFGWTGAVLAAGAVAAAIMVRRAPQRGPVLAVLAAAVLLAGAYVVTPYSAFGPEGRPVLAAASTRYALPALMAMAALAAWAASRLGRWRLGAEAVLALAVLDGLRRGFDLDAAKVLGGTVAMAALAAGVWWLASRLRASRALAAAGTALTVAAGAALADGVRVRANEQGYGQFDSTLAWIEREAPSGRRIALAGVWSPQGVSPVLPAFGPRLGNDVVALGEFREHMLRHHTSPEPFLAQLAGFDLLLVGRGAPPRPETREERWALGAGWRPVAGSPRLALLAAP